jgi:hypothetical protein
MSLLQKKNLQEALIWINELKIMHPNKSLGEIISEASIKYDLTPLECEFLINQLKK